MTEQYSLSELQRMIAGKASLEAKRAELYKQKNAYYSQVISLRAMFRQEQEDVEKLEGPSLTNYFYQFVGKLDEKLDQERREAYAARVKLEAAERELNGIEADLSEIESQLSGISIAQAQYQEELEKKRRALKASETPVAARILETENKIAALESQKREVNEAIAAGNSARSTAECIMSELDDADGWNTWDMIGGGGVLTHMAKHSHLDEAQDLVYKLQSQLRRFKTELTDIQIDADLQVNVDGFLRFADYFFDGIFADWAVGDRISQSRSSVESTKSQIGRMLVRLEQMQTSLDREVTECSKELENLIVNA